jgi:hypothetical protein
MGPVTTLAIIALVWAGVSILGTLLVVRILRVGTRGDEDREPMLAASRLGLEGIGRERPLVVAGALHVVARRRAVGHRPAR